MFPSGSSEFIPQSQQQRPNPYNNNNNRQYNNYNNYERNPHQQQLQQIQNNGPHRSPSRSKEPKYPRYQENRDRARPRHQYSYYDRENSNFTGPNHYQRAMGSSGVERNNPPPRRGLIHTDFSKANLGPAGLLLPTASYELHKGLRNNNKNKNKNNRSTNNKTSVVDIASSLGERSEDSSSSTRTKNHHDATRRLYFCPKCDDNYGFYLKQNAYNGRLPLVLHCGHTICQMCAYEELRDNKISCPICAKDSIVEQAPGRYASMQNIFTPNFYIIGLVLYRKTQQQNESFNNLDTMGFKIATTSKIKKPKLRGSSSDNCCFEECFEESTMYCATCEGYYCDSCCATIHKLTPKLSSHQPVSKLVNKFTLELQFCAIHPEFKMEFFCKTCQINACCHCMLDGHNTHDRIALYSMTPAEIEEFKKLQKVAGKVLKQIFLTQKKVEQVANFDISLLKRIASDYFANCHGKLQNFEHEIFTNLENYKDNNSSIYQIHSKLQKSAEELHQLISVHEKNLKSTFKLNYREALEKLRNIEEIPRFLINKTGHFEPIRLVIDNKMLENMHNDIKIEENFKDNYQLVNESNAPEDYAVLDDDATMESAKSSESEMKQIKILRRPSESTSVASTNNSAKKANKILRKRTDEKYHSLNTERVYLKQINSIDSIFVQIQKDENRFSTLKKNIENYVQSAGAQAVETPDLNEMYLALYKSDSSKEQKIWARARLIGINNDNDKYEMFFIDYGKIQNVDKARIKDISVFLCQHRPYAIECKLRNRMNVTFNDNAHVALSKILSGKEIYMVRTSSNNEITEVDLLTASSDSGLASVYDILVHAYKSTGNNGRGSGGNHNEEESSLTSPMNYNTTSLHEVFPCSRNFAKNQTEKIRIVNVVDPYTIYVHLEKYEEYFHNLCKSMRTAFRKSTLKSCIPIEGTYVLVEYEDPMRSNWHRALVISVDLLAGKAHVALVDWGLNVIVPINNIRSIEESFTRLESQALLVHMAHIAPYNKQRTWAPYSINFLMDYQKERKSVKMVVHECGTDLKVVFFDSIGSNGDICINALMVENNLADSTGSLSENVNWQQLEQEPSSVREEENPEIQDLTSLLLQKFDKEAQDESDDENIKSIKKLPVEIVKYISPDVIWLNLGEHIEKNERFFSQLRISYAKDDNPTKEKWNKDDLCVVNINNYEYVRGRIIKKIDDDGQQYEINVFDKREIAVVKKDKIFICDEGFFSNFNTCTIKGHLANILPAGDTGKWSISSTETLNSIFKKHSRLYASKPELPLTNYTENKSLSLTMWYGLVILGGPLEADRIKFVSINNTLVKLGYAYKIPKPLVSDELELKPLSDDDKTLEEEEEEKEESIPAPIIEDAETEILESTEKVQKLTSYENSQRETEEEVKTWHEMLQELEESEINNDDEDDEVASQQNSDETETHISEDVCLQNTEECDNSKETEDDKPITDWLPAFRFTKSEFWARVTCVETGGHLFLHEQDKDEMYNEMEKNLMETLNENPPQEEINRQWKCRDMCTIKYIHGNDEKWYRGSVLKEKSKNVISVYMIDFGSDHDLSPKDLFSEIYYPKMRPFATKVKLNKVYTRNGTWLTSDYDVFHSLVTDWCKIVVQGTKDIDVPVVDVYNEHGVHVNTELVLRCRNLYKCGIFHDDAEPTEDDEAVVIIEDEPDVEEESEELSPLKYESLPLPEELLKPDEKILMEIGGVINCTRIALKLPTELSAVVELWKEIQENIEQLPILTQFAIGTPCIAQFCADNTWYRAEIIDVSKLTSGVVTILFVDYGNLEDNVDIHNLKATTYKFMELPRQTWMANVNIQLKTDDKHGIMSVWKLFNAIDGSTKYIQMVKKDPFTVDLYNKNDSLVYEHLLQKGILEKFE